MNSEGHLQHPTAPPPLKIHQPHSGFHLVSTFPPSRVALFTVNGCLFVFVCVCRRLNTLNKCALMRLDISPQRKRVCTHTHARS